MAKDQTKRISPKTLRQDLDTLAAINDMSDYAPANNKYTKVAIEAKKSSMEAAQVQETQKKAIFDAARDSACAAEWDFHNFILQAKEQVKAQYGDDSDQAQAVGFVKKSERKSPTRKTKPTS